MEKLEVDYFSVTNHNATVCACMVWSLSFTCMIIWYAEYESILRIVNNHYMIEYKAEKREDESTFVQSLNFLVKVNLQFCAKCMMINTLNVDEHID